MKRLLLIFLSIFIFTSCVTEKDRVQRALDFAGQNSAELGKVLEHYKNDSLKLKAARWLIENMVYQVSLDSTSVSENQPYYDLLIEYRQRHGTYSDATTYFICDSLFNAKGGTLVPTAQYKKDVESISAHFLISHIDQSFEAWRKYLWSQAITFEDFCRYILPYKCNWDFWEKSFPYLRSKYAYLADSMKGKSLVEVGKFIDGDLKARFKQDGPFLRERPYMRPTTQSNYIRAMLGECIQANATVTLALRSMGIPATIDFIPYWGNSNAGHSWAKIIGDSSGRLYNNEQIMYSGPEDKLINDMFWFEFVFSSISGIPEDVYIRSCRTVPKVYRSHFEIKNEPSLSSQLDVPALFLNPSQEDVTDEYLECTDIVVPLTENKKTDRWAYLCCYDPDHISWIPVAQGRVDGKSAIFPNIGKNIVYLPGFYRQGEIVPAGNPFLLSTQGEMLDLKPGVDRHSEVKLYSKVPYRTSVLYWAYAMVNARFQTANRSDLSDTVTVHLIDKIPYYGQQVEIHDSRQVRYGIYEFGGRPGFIAELEFWGIGDDGTEIKLSAKPIGNPGVYGQSWKELSDGDRVSFFSRDWNRESFVGFDFGKPYRITKIVYHPRSDDNGVVPGELYELFYWDNEWKSFGQQFGRDDKTLVYKYIPKNVLLRLHNLSRGKENRIFIYDQGKQIFY